MDYYVLLKEPVTGVLVETYGFHLFLRKLPNLILVFKMFSACVGAV